jgi:GT2 family glycosyltransferase
MQFLRPGCNMAFHRWALEAIGGFDPILRQSGDAVDVCWPLQENNYKIGFTPAGFGWHYRRSTVSAYRKQRVGCPLAPTAVLDKAAAEHKMVRLNDD